MFKLKQTIQDHTQAHYSNIIYLYTFTLQYKVILKYTDLVSQRQVPVMFLLSRWLNGFHSPTSQFVFIINILLFSIYVSRSFLYNVAMFCWCMDCLSWSLFLTEMLIDYMFYVYQLSFEMFNVLNIEQTSFDSGVDETLCLDL